MRLNKYLAHATGVSRRSADEAITDGRVAVNAQPAQLGQVISSTDTVQLDGQTIVISDYRYLLINKPLGYVSSRKAQSAPTLYKLLPARFHTLKIVGRLDKDTSGLILLTDDGDYANQLMHPRYKKLKTYQLRLDRPLSEKDLEAVNRGVQLEDGLSKLQVTANDSGGYKICMRQGRNRQIRRTFQALGYQVAALQRTTLGPFSLDDLNGEQLITVKRREI